MIAHVVLFRPRPTLSAPERQNVLDAFSTAVREIPSVRRARVGRRITHGRPGYEQLMRAAFDYVAVIEFDDRPGLMAYLEHPSHERLGALFFDAFEEALMYDYELSESGAFTLA